MLIANAWLLVIVLTPSAPPPPPNAAVPLGSLCSVKVTPSAGLPDPAPAWKVNEATKLAMPTLVLNQALLASLPTLVVMVSTSLVILGTPAVLPLSVQPVPLPPNPVTEVPGAGVGATTRLPPDRFTTPRPSDPGTDTTLPALIVMPPVKVLLPVTVRVVALFLTTAPGAVPSRIEPANVTSAGWERVSVLPFRATEPVPVREDTVGLAPRLRVPPLTVTVGAGPKAVVL